MDKKLRIGLLMDSFNVPNWIYVMLEKIIQSDYAKIELVILNDTPKEEKSKLSNFIKNYNHLLYMLYRKCEEKRSKNNSSAFETKNLKFLLTNIPVLKIRPRQGKFSDWIEGGDIKTIEGYGLDVLVRLGFRILKGEVLNSAKFGIWSYHHADNHVNRGGPAGFWEVHENNPVTGSILQILTEDLDSGIVLHRSYSKTNPLNVSKNLNNYYWKTLLFLPRKLQELSRIGEKEFFNKISKENEHISFYSNRLYVYPDNAEMLKLLIRLFAKVIKAKYLKFVYTQIYFNQWCLMFNLTDRLSTSFWKFKKILPPKDRFWADPCVIEKSNKYYIFIEESLYTVNKGHISLLIMDEDGRYGTPKKIIGEPYHLSHPFVFEWEGNHYMIPETTQNRTINLYKCVTFPTRWELQCILMKNIVAIDATPFRYKQKWWLFANVQENIGVSPQDELFLYFSDSLLSNNWIPHPSNPIVSDVRKARPGGRIFEQNGKIYRPSQDSSRGYGYGLKINQIVKLTATEYEETEIDHIAPKWDKNIRAIHHIDHKNRLTIIDGQIRRSKYF